MQWVADTAQAVIVAGAFCWGAYALAKSIRDEYAEVYHFWRTKWMNG